MTLKDKLQDAIKDAMRAKDQDSLRALRALKSMILLAETEEGRTGDLTEEDEMKLISKAIKQRKDSAKIYQEQNRTDLYEKEAIEIKVLELFLPAQLSDEEIVAQVKQIVAEVGATSMKDMGKVMGVAGKRLGGSAEASKIASAVKAALA